MIKLILFKRKMVNDPATITEYKKMGQALDELDDFFNSADNTKMFSGYFEEDGRAILHFEYTPHAIDFWIN